jgi:hypothetical protein
VGGDRDGNVWDEKPFRLNQEEFDLLRAVERRRTVGEPANGYSVGAIRRLAERGAVDLLAASG